MDRPENPFRRGSVIWLVMEGGLQGEFDGLPGWEDLTTEEIAEVLGSSRNTVSCAIGDIRRDTGYRVPCVDGRGRRLKDSMNELTFDILVAKDYYDTVNVGDVISDDFRVGSLIVHGSFGNWKVTVDKKEVI